VCLCRGHVTPWGRGGRGACGRESAPWSEGAELRGVRGGVLGGTGENAVCTGGYWERLGDTGVCTGGTGRDWAILGCALGGYWERLGRLQHALGVLGETERYWDVH